MVVLITTYVVLDYPDYLQFGGHKQFVDPGYSMIIWPINGGGTIYDLEVY